MAGRPKGDGEATRTKAVLIAGQLFSEKGYEGVGLQDIVTKAGIPKGSLYFHFPEGKEQLALEAMTVAAATYHSSLSQALDEARRQGLPLEGLIRAAFSALRHHLSGNAFKSACPVAPLALANPSESIRQRASQIYEQWVTDIQSMLSEFRISHAQCTAILASVEGALLLARSHQSLAPLDCAEDLIISALAKQRA